MIVSGDPIRADEALKTGLVDEIVEGDLAAAGVAFAEKVLNEKRPLKKIRDLNDKIAAAKGKPEIFADFRKSVARQTRGFRAPENCIKAVEAAVNMPFDEGIKRERELFLKLVSGDQSKAQRHIFFAEREALKIPDMPAGTKARDVSKVAVIGAGTMGGGIAMCFATVGIPVTIIETAEDALTRGLSVIEKNYRATAARGGMTPEQAEKRFGLIKGAIGLEAAADADMVIEAVFEHRAVGLVQLGRISVRVKEVAHELMDVSTVHPGPDRGDCEVERLLDEPGVLPDLVGHAPDRERPGHVRVTA